MHCRYCGKPIRRLFVAREYCCDDHQNKYREQLFRVLETSQPAEEIPAIADFCLNGPSTALAPSRSRINGNANPLVGVLASIHDSGISPVVPPGAALGTRSMALFSAPAPAASPPLRPRGISDTLVTLVGNAPQISPLRTVRSRAFAGPLMQALAPEIAHLCARVWAERLKETGEFAYSGTLVVPSAMDPVAPRVHSPGPARATAPRASHAPASGVPFPRSRLEFLCASLAASVSPLNGSVRLPPIPIDSHGFIIESAARPYMPGLSPLARVPNPMAAPILAGPLDLDRNSEALGLPPSPGLRANFEPMPRSPEVRRLRPLEPLTGTSGSAHPCAGAVPGLATSSALGIGRLPAGGGIAQNLSFRQSRSPEIPGVAVLFAAFRRSPTPDSGHTEAFAFHAPVTVPVPLKAGMVGIPAPCHTYQHYGLRPAVAEEPGASATPGRHIAARLESLSTFEKLKTVPSAGPLVVVPGIAVSGLISDVPSPTAERTGAEFRHRLEATSIGTRMRSTIGPRLSAFSQRLPSPEPSVPQPSAVFRMPAIPATMCLRPLFGAEAIDPILYPACAFLPSPADAKPSPCGADAMLSPVLVHARSAVQKSTKRDSEYLMAAWVDTRGTCPSVDCVSPGLELNVRTLRPALVAHLQDSLSKCAATWATKEQIAVLPACSMRLWPPRFEQLALQGASGSRFSVTGWKFLAWRSRSALEKCAQPAMGRWKSLATAAALVTALGAGAYHLRFGEFLRSERESFGRLIRERAAIELSDTFGSGFASWEGGRDWARTWSYTKDGCIRAGQLALYRPSLALSDYQMEFLTLVEHRSVGWVVRARDLRNYYAMKLTVVKPGLPPELALVRYSVIDGVRGASVQIPVRTIVDSRTPYPVRVEVKGNQFSAFLRNELIDTWSEGRLTHGGVGLFVGPGESALIYWMRLSSQTDSLGRLCAVLAKSGAAATNGAPETKE